MLYPTLELLVRKELVSRERVIAVMNSTRNQRQGSGKVLAKLIEEQDITEKQLIEVVTGEYHCPVTTLETGPLETRALQQLPQEVAESCLVFPVSLSEHMLKVAMSDPGDNFTIGELSFYTSYPIEPVFALPRAIKAAIEKYYSSAEAPYRGQICSNCGQPLE